MCVLILHFLWVVFLSTYHLLPPPPPFTLPQHCSSKYHSQKIIFICLIIAVASIHFFFLFNSNQTFFLFTLTRAHILIFALLFPPPPPRVFYDCKPLGRIPGTDMGQSSSSVTEGIDGFQVVRVLPNSPAHRAGMLPYFDIITAVGHEKLVEVSPDTFKSVIAKYKDQKLVVTLYNLRVQAYRDVDLVPSGSWGGRGLLGCSIEWANARDCMTRCWHILEIAPDSPASQCADVKAERDYIVGMQPPEEQVITMLRDQTDFENRLEMWRTLRRTAMLQRAHFGSRRHPTNDLGESHARAQSGGSSAADAETEYYFPDSLLFLIYDSEANSIRELVVDMSSRKENLEAEDYNDPVGVGFALGIGYLHMIPVKQDSDLPVMKRFYIPDNTPEQDVHPSPPATTATAAPDLGLEEPVHTQEQEHTDAAHQPVAAPPHVESTPQHQPTAPESESNNHIPSLQQQQQNEPVPLAPSETRSPVPSVESTAYVAFDRFPQFPELKTTFPPAPNMSTVSTGPKNDASSSTHPPPPPVSAPRLPSHTVGQGSLGTHPLPSAAPTAAAAAPHSQSPSANVDRHAADEHAWAGDRRPPPFVFPKMPPPLEFPRFPNQQ